MRSRLAIAVVIMVAALTILFAAPAQETAGEVTTVAPPTTVAPEPKARVEVERPTTTSTTAPMPTSPPTTPVTTVPETVPPTTAAPITAPPVTAAPTPPLAPAPTGGIEGIIYAAAAEFGVSGDFMVCVARRESTLNPLAVNSSSGAMGLFQHLPQYWGARAAALGYGYDSWSDPTANARVSAWLLQTSGPSHWASTASPC